MVLVTRSPPTDTQRHKTCPMSLCSWVWGSGIQAGLSDPGRGLGQGHSLGYLGGSGFFPAWWLQGIALSSGAWHLSSCAWTGPRCLAIGGQPRLQGRQRDLCVCGGDTPTLLPQDRCVHDTLGIGPAENGGLWQAQTSQAQALPAARGERIRMGPALCLPLRVPTAPLPQAPVRSRALSPGHEEHTRAEMEPGGCLEKQLRPCQPWASFNYDKNASLCLLGLEWAKQPFLAAVWSQAALCQADGLGGSGMCLVSSGFMRGRAGGLGPAGP